MSEDPDLWQKITALPRPWKAVDYPRNGADGQPIGQIAVVILLQEEQSLAAASANDAARKLIKELPKAGESQTGFEDVYRNFAAAEVLWRACLDKAQMENGIERKVFPSPAELRRKLNVDEIGILFSNYLTVQEELGPIISNLNAEEVKAWITRLKESGSKLPLDSLSSEGLKSLVLILVGLLPSSPTDSTSPGSPPSSSGESSPANEG